MNLNESCAEITVSTSPLTPKKEEPVLNNENEASTSTSRSSPEPCCPICLGKLENKSFTDSCLHQFCFKCLLEWSKVKAECPLCKQSFKSIIHNVRSIEDYEQYYLTTSATEGTLYVSREIFARLESSQPTSYREPSNYRFRTSAVSSYLDYFVRLEEAISHRVIPPGPGVSGGVLWQRRRQRGTSDFRRNIYQQGLWVQRTSDVTGRVRECSPDFYRANPTQVHRLVPWLNRELNVLLYENSPHIQHVMSRILELITQVPIRSPGFASVIGPYIGRHTEHFIHEFHSFAISPFDLVGYDRHANYVGRSEIVDYEDVTRDSDSDVQVLEEGVHRPSSPLIQLVETDSDDCIVLDAPMRAEPEVITLDSDNDDDVVQISIQTSVRPAQSTTTVQCAEPGPSRRPRLRRNWLTVNNVAVPSTSQSTSCEISISIEHSTRSVSPTVSEASSASWTPTHPRRLHKVKKVRAAGRKGKATQATVKQRITSESDDGDAATRRRAVACIPSSTSDESDSDNAPARAPCTQRPSVSVCPSTSTASRWSSDSSLSSSSEEEYKPRLRSVVVKSTVKPEPRAVSPVFRPHSSSPYSSPFSPQSYTDIPSSSRSRHHRRHSTSSSADLNTPTKKCKHSRKRHKRDK